METIVRTDVGSGNVLSIEEEYGQVWITIRDDRHQFQNVRIPVKSLKKALKEQEII